MSIAIEKPNTRLVIVWQSVLAILVTAAAFVLGDAAWAKSVFLGSLVAVIPNGYFAWRAFRYNQTRSAEKVLGSFFLAEMGKVALTALLFAATFKWGQPLHAVSVFVGFIVVMMTGLAGSALLLHRQ